MTLDSEATTPDAPCAPWTRYVAAGMTIDVHFDRSGQLPVSCRTWINECAVFTAPTPNAASSLGGGLADGALPIVLGSGCGGSWDLLMADYSASTAMGTTPLPGVRSYFLHRGFAPNDTPACHAQFGTFDQGTAVCRDTWAVHLTPSGI